MEKQRVRRLLGTLGILAAIGIVLVAVYQLWGVGIPCLFYRVTRLYCPGCGTMRAVVALTRLNLPGALRYNALFVATLPVLLGLAVWQAVCYLRGKPFKTGPLSWALVAVFAVCVVVFTILRNLPGFAFLAPGPLYG
ncbi:DUF2752 domain-containing protein [Ruminococcaceae bacterium OttesenSCG-928-A16]|nr:DUF2752 domain-containing protein [Ruminococcaceae bacterium OttesenSCG-928-A16]